MQIANPQLNITANRMATKWVAEIHAQVDSLSEEVQAGCWKVILDRCALQRPNRSASLTSEQMVENIEQRARALHEKHRNRWKWPTYYVEFSQDCGFVVPPATDTAAVRFASSVSRALNSERYNLAQLLKKKDAVVASILTFHGHRRVTLVSPEALEGVRLGDEWISKMEAEIVDMELKGRERFWEKVALAAKAWDAAVEV